LEPEREPRTARGTVRFVPRRFPVERLTLPRPMVELDPDTERRALAEAQRLTAVFRAITADRLWRGRFTRPVGGTLPGTGFGARRIINGAPRSPHGGIDYSMPLGTPVVAANTGRMAPHPPNARSTPAKPWRSSMAKPAVERRLLQPRRLRRRSRRSNPVSPTRP